MHESNKLLNTLQGIYHDRFSLCRLSLCSGNTLGIRRREVSAALCIPNLNGRACSRASHQYYTTVLIHPLSPFQSIVPFLSPTSTHDLSTSRMYPTHAPNNLYAAGKSLLLLVVVMVVFSSVGGSCCIVEYVPRDKRKSSTGCPLAWPTFSSWVAPVTFETPFPNGYTSRVYDAIERVLGYGYRSSQGRTELFLFPSRYFNVLKLSHISYNLFL